MSPTPSSSPDTVNSPGRKAVIIPTPVVCEHPNYLYYPKTDVHVRSDLNQAYRAFLFRWNTCTACPLSNTKSLYVHYSGFIPAEILFIGEAPGQSEDAIGRPFVGPAGSIFQQLIGNFQARLASVSGPSPKIGVTNVLSCIPWANVHPTYSSTGELHGYSRTGTKTRPPSSSEISACSSRLRNLISLVQPSRLVLLGNVAVSLHGLDLYPDVPTLELPHPAYILRHYRAGAERRRTINDYAIRLQMFFDSTQE